MASLIFCDLAFSWVRSLADACSAHTLVASIEFRPVYKWSHRRTRVQNLHTTCYIPGWTRFRKPSSSLAVRKLKHLIKSTDENAILVFTLPQFAEVAAKFPESRRVYYATDPFETYDGWCPSSIRDWTAKMLKNTDAAFAVSERLCRDFKGITGKPVFRQPNGLPPSLLKPSALPAKPSDLPGTPVIGCIGQIGSAYDWEILNATARENPTATLVMIGNFIKSDKATSIKFRELTSRPNVRWLGHRPSHQLSAYRAHFDVGVCPIRADFAGHRRSILRLYDEISYGHPIVSTALDSAQEHVPHVSTAESPLTFAKQVSEYLSGVQSSTSIDERRSYLLSHTWEARAETFLNSLNAVYGNAGKERCV